MFSMLTLLYALNTYLTLTKINKYCRLRIIHFVDFFFSIPTARMSFTYYVINTNNQIYNIIYSLNIMISKWLHLFK